MTEENPTPEQAQEPTPIDPTEAMEAAMRYANNRFDADGGGASGTFSIEGGTMAVDGPKAGQWLWVEGSALNDGLWRYPLSGMADEEFEGRVLFLRVPRGFEAVCREIAEWQAANAEALSGPYQSESFGGYSYSMAGGGAQGNEAPAAAWQLRFGARLRPWRRLSRDWT